MLVCKVGDKEVNTIDFNGSDLRSWSNKKILKCPICDNKLIYKNGLVKIPHFAHVSNDDCHDIYYENETKEHMMGKMILYKWLKEFPDIKVCKLEGWIPETKQRPDIYLELQDGTKIVIEFQCTPITLEQYLNRHDLYRLIGINDFWILGTDKYKLFKSQKGRLRVLQEELLKENNYALHLDSYNEKIYKYFNLKEFRNINKNIKDVVFNYDNVFNFNIGDNVDSYDPFEYMKEKCKQGYFQSNKDMNFPSYRVLENTTEDKYVIIGDFKYENQAKNYINMYIKELRNNFKIIKIEKGDSYGISKN